MIKTKKQHIKNFALCFFLSLPLTVAPDAAEASPRWKLIGPPGGRVATIKAHPSSSDIFATAQSCRVRKSTDNGASWPSASDDFNSFDHVVDLAIAPSDKNTLYAALTGGGVNETLFKSTNGGRNWQLKNSGLPDERLSAVTVHPLNPQITYAGTGSYSGTALGIYKTIDGGDSWIHSSTGLTDTVISSIVIDPATPTTLYASTLACIEKSIDSGASWTNPRTGIPAGGCNDGKLIIDPANPQTLYLATDNRGIFKTTDGGTGWTAINTGLPTNQINGITLDSNNSNILYAATETGYVYKTIDGGTNWSLLGTDRITHSPISALLLHGGALYAGTYGVGIFKSTDDGATWDWSSKSLNCNGTTALTIDPNNDQTLYTGTEQYGSLYKTTDRGRTWQIINNSLVNTKGDFVGARFSLAVASSNSQILYLPSGQGLFTSVNGGASWSEVTLPVIAGGGITPYSIAIDPSNSQILYLTGNKYPANGGVVYKSINGGGTWTLSSTGIQATESKGNIIAIDPSNTQVLYLATYNTGLYKSIDGGASWTGLTTGFPAAKNTQDLVIDSTDTNIVYVAIEETGVYRTDDGGTTWASITAGLSQMDGHGVAVHPIVHTTIYIGQEYWQGVHFSEDSGQTWQEKNRNLGDWNVSTVRISSDGNRLYAATAMGIFEWDFLGGFPWHMYLEPMLGISRQTNP